VHGGGSLDLPATQAAGGTVMLTIPGHHERHRAGVDDRGNLGARALRPVGAPILTPTATPGAATAAPSRDGVR
jgi:hypothetical protein